MNLSNQSLYAYTVRGRVIWLSPTLFNVSVIDELYRAHKIDNGADADHSNCTDFVVEFFNKFSPNRLIKNPVAGDDALEFKMAHEKIKAFVKLSELVNHSYSLSLPAIFDREEDKVRILAESMVDTKELKADELEKHFEFVHKLIQDKKQELGRRYLSFVHKLKAAKDIQEVTEISYQIVFEGLHVV